MPRPLVPLTRRLARILLVTLVLLMHGPATLASGDGRTYRFGVMPYLSTTRLEQAYAPLAAAFARRIGHPVRFGTAADMAGFTHRVEQGVFDFALVPPFAVVPLVDRLGWQALARRPSRPSRIVVLINSPLKKVTDLRGKVLGLPRRHGPVNDIIRISLLQHGLQADEDYLTRNYPSTPSCLHKLLVNRVDACATGGGAGLRNFERRMGVRLRTLYRTEPFPHMLLVARPDFPAEHARELQDFILGLKDSEQGRELLRRIGPDIDFVPYRSRDYDVIRRYRRLLEPATHASPVP